MTTSPTPPREVLLFGATGPIGAALLPRLRAAGHRVHAVTRRAATASGHDVTHGLDHGVQWHRGSLPDAIDALPARVDAIFSAGPLDLFAAWHAAHAPRAARVLAFGSTSVHVKRDSTDPAERDVAARLAAAEARLFADASLRGTALTVLRPTLVYGSGREANLARIVAISRRLGGVPLPADAHGRRQPVHVDDLAAAALAAWPCVVGHGRAYDLPGGEVLPYDVMVARVLAVLDPPGRVWRVPAGLFDRALAAAHAVGRARGFTATMRQRLREDLVFDAAPATTDFDYAPRAFQPTAAMFPPG